MNTSISFVPAIKPNQKGFIMTKFNLKTKIDKACFIASVLFKQPVTINHWKVQDLMSWEQSKLDNLVVKAEEKYNKLGLNF